MEFSQNHSVIHYCRSMLNEIVQGSTIDSDRIADTRYVKRSSFCTRQSPELFVDPQTAGAETQMIESLSAETTRRNNIRRRIYARSDRRVFFIVANVCVWGRSTPRNCAVNVVESGEKYERIVRVFKKRMQIPHRLAKKLWKKPFHNELAITAYGVCRDTRKISVARKATCQRAIQKRTGKKFVEFWFFFKNILTGVRASWKVCRIVALLTRSACRRIIHRTMPISFNGLDEQRQYVYVYDGKITLTITMFASNNIFTLRAWI